MTVLPGLNNVFGKIPASKLTSYFQNIFCDFSSAYRRHHSRKTTLLRLVEDWKKSRDKGELVAIVTMDLSKALDGPPHLLLVKKVQAYGLDNRSCSFLLGYLQNRLQRVKIEDAVSSWEFASRGVPQGSILGPLFFSGAPARAKPAWDRAPYSWNIVNLFSFGCHVIYRAYVRVY